MEVAYFLGRRVLNTPPLNGAKRSLLLLLFLAFLCVRLCFYGLSPPIILLQTEREKQRNHRTEPQSERGLTMEIARITQNCPVHFLCFSVYPNFKFSPLFIFRWRSPHQSIFLFSQTCLWRLHTKHFLNCCHHVYLMRTWNPWLP